MQIPLVNTSPIGVSFPWRVWGSHSGIGFALILEIENPVRFWECIEKNVEYHANTSH